MRQLLSAATSCAEGDDILRLEQLKSFTYVVDSEALSAGRVHDPTEVVIRIAANQDGVHLQVVGMRVRVGVEVGVRSKGEL